jgi:hypothetical protein
MHRIPDDRELNKRVTAVRHALAPVSVRQKLGRIFTLDLLPP